MGVFMRFWTCFSCLLIGCLALSQNATATSDDKCNISLSRLAGPMVSADSTKESRILGLDPAVHEIHRKILKGDHVIVSGSRLGGKTSAVTAFAQALRDGELDQKLNGAIVINFNWKTAASAPESIKGDLAKTELSILQQLESRWREMKSKGSQPIIYIDDINSLFAPEPGKALPFQDKITDMIKRLSEEKIIQIIGETTGPIPSSADRFLSQRFGQVEIKDLTEDQRLSVLRQSIAKLESRYPGVKFSKDAVVQILKSSKSMGTSGMLEIAEEAAVKSYLSRADRIDSIRARAHRINELKDHLDFLNAADDLDVTNSMKLELAKLEAEHKKDIEQRDRELQIVAEKKTLETELADLSAQIEAIVRTRGDKTKLAELEQAASQKRLKLESISSQLAEVRKNHQVISLEITSNQIIDTAKQVGQRLQEIESLDKPWRVIEKPSVKLEDVKGMELAKAEIQRTMDTLEFPNLTEMILKGNSGTSMLFYGPPGNGKTLIATAAAAYFDAPIMILETNKIMSKWQGESEQNIKAFFAEVRRRAEKGRVFVFMDEVDSIARDRSLSLGGSESKTAVLNIILQELQGFDGKLNNVVIMAATNKPWELDPAFTRAGRFDNKVYIGPPDVSARVALLEKAFSGLESQLPVNSAQLIQSLAARMDGWSGAEIAEGFGGNLRKQLFSQAVKMHRSGELKANELPPLTTELIESVYRDLSRTYPEVSGPQLKVYEDFSNRRAQKEQSISEIPPGSLTTESGQ